jgi:dUTP pyrophosphatase
MPSLPSLTLKISLLHPQASLPRKAHPSDACFDVTACQALTLEAGATGLVRLGWAMQLEEGWEARLRGRSGLASRGIVAHHGTIDHLYRQEVKVILHNLSGEPFWIEPGDRIAQLTVAPVHPVVVVAATIEETERGGFGSTGIGQPSTKASEPSPANLSRPISQDSENRPA